VAHVFRAGLATPAASGLALFASPLSRVFDAAERHIERAGGQVRKGTPVDAIEVRGRQVRGVILRSGERIAADAVIIAVPPAALGSIARGIAELEAVGEAAARLQWSPILDVHHWFDRPVLDRSFAMVLDSPLQAVFDLSSLHRRSESGKRTHLVLSQSAADDWMDRPIDEVLDALLLAMRDRFPAVSGARLLAHRVIRHRDATFIPAPGADTLRPQPTTPVRGLLLAGDWTATGWPSTIESAVRSGVRAAGLAIPGA
jgi:uncharacterized protein with NAD-binding domain and iron-sulfur cluster